LKGDTFKKHQKAITLVTLPKTNRQFAPENRLGPKGKFIFQPLISRGKLAASFRECMVSIVYTAWEVDG